LQGYPATVEEVFDLRQLRLRPGEVRRERLEVVLDPFLLGGQRYEATPASVPTELEVVQPSGALVLDLGARVGLTGPCMRCLEEASAEIVVSAREFHDQDAPAGDELRSDYVDDGRLRIGAWLRDAVALEIPDRILCRADCAGLCPVCGKDLNVDPHVHEDTEPDPRWAGLADLREEL